MTTRRLALICGLAVLGSTINPDPVGAEERDIRVAVGAGIAAPFLNQYTNPAPALAVAARRPLRSQLELTATLHVTRPQIEGAQRWSQHFLVGTRLRPFARFGLFIELGLGITLARERLDLEIDQRSIGSTETRASAAAALTLGWEFADRYFAQATVRPYLPGSAQFLDLALLVGVTL